MASLPSTLSSIQYRSFPPRLSPSYFPRFPFRPPCRHSRIAPSHRSSPPSYFTRFPFRPPCRHSRIVPFHRSSPQAISHGFPSVHPVVTPVSLLSTGALHKLFPTVSPPSILSSLPYRSLATKCLNENPSIGDAFGKKIHKIALGCPRTSIAWQRGLEDGEIYIQTRASRSRSH